MTVGAFDEEEKFLRPHPKLGLTPFIIIEEALRVAWKMLCESGFDVKSSKEDIITHALYEILLDKVFNKGLVGGFSKETFSKPTREAKISNFNGEHLDKMPDLLVAFIDRPAGVQDSQDWIFIECKPVNTTHTVGQKYCDDGLIRFVRGDYAWAMTEALMVAYAQPKYNIMPKLVTALKNVERQKRIPTEVFPRLCSHKKSKENSSSQAVQESQHRRTFKYAGDTEDAPSIIG